MLDATFATMMGVFSSISPICQMIITPFMFMYICFGNKMMRVKSPILPHDDNISGPYRHVYPLHA